MIAEHQIRMRKTHSKTVNDFISILQEVAWDVDTIYFSHDSHEMCLQDFEHLDHRDLICIISALEHNTYFRFELRHHS